MTRRGRGGRPLPGSGYPIRRLIGPDDAACYLIRLYLGSALAVLAMLLMHGLGASDDAQGFLGALVLVFSVAWAEVAYEEEKEEKEETKDEDK